MTEFASRCRDDFAAAQQIFVLHALAARTRHFRNGLFRDNRCDQLESQLCRTS